MNVTDCEWKAQAGNPCVASFDWTCSGICRSVDRMPEVHQRCGEGDDAVWSAMFQSSSHWDIIIYLYIIIIIIIIIITITFFHPFKISSPPIQFHQMVSGCKYRKCGTHSDMSTTTPHFLFFCSLSLSLSLSIMLCRPQNVINYFFHKFNISERN